ncbi:hypothetical protein [Actinokineospora xionganensis]|uniref:Uncharacterized protein n=1 Tax=Actinokineospora xionganensis TaxID=2684470 RepID=A0ABR7L977_9PSEU|nr:hypothetical protein [Actinokineospora xionganensis]MBC6449261.1 hypothetical protein [Actinokineospora xionganensis]
MAPRRVTRPRAFRAARGALLATTSTALTIAAHGMAGGGVPETAVTVVIAALIAWAGTAVASRARSLSAMVALLGTSQLTLHVLFAYVSHGHDAVALTPTMLATHVVAIGATAVLLTQADAALDLVAAAITGLVRALVWTPSPPALVVHKFQVSTVGHLLEVVFRQVCARRGPPRFS